MKTARIHALLALTAAGALWGTSVPLTKAALGGLGPLWLTVVRFAVACAILLVALRPRLRDVRPALVWSGALGYGGVIAVQNLGLTMTSVTHAALLIGATPVVVAVLAVFFDGARVGPIAWAGFSLSTAGILLVAGAGGGDASLTGDALVFLSVLVGAAFTLVQGRLLPGQDVVAVSAAQFLSSALLVVPVAVAAEGLPNVTAIGAGPWLATAGLAVAGTVLPYTLFALGQTGVPAHVAGVFLNLETLVATTIGATVFGEVLTVPQIAGGLVLLLGILLSVSKPADPVDATAPATVAPAEEQPALQLVPVLATTSGHSADWYDAGWDEPVREAA